MRTRTWRLLGSRYLALLAASLLDHATLTAMPPLQQVERLTKAANLLQVTLINIMVHVAFQHSALLTRVFSAPCT